MLLWKYCGSVGRRNVPLKPWTSHRVNHVLELSSGGGCQERPSPFSNSMAKDGHVVSLVKHPETRHYQDPSKHCSCICSALAFALAQQGGESEPCLKLQAQHRGLGAIVSTLETVPVSKLWECACTHKYMLECILGD